MSMLLLAEPLARKTGEAAKAGPIGLAVIILLCVACYFLFKSMSKHMRTVRERFPDPNADMTVGVAADAELTASASDPTPADPDGPQPEHVPPAGERPPADDA
jgi:hypothetical protein